MRLKVIILSLFLLLMVAIPSKAEDYSTRDSSIYNLNKDEIRRLKKQSVEGNFVFIPNSSDIKPRVALVLSGGGARGFSQVGAIESLAESGVSIDYVVGTSIGAVVGGLYATGYTPRELDSIFINTDWNTFLRLNRDQTRNDLFIDQKQISDRSIIKLKFNNFRFVVPEAIMAGTKYNAFIQKLIWQGIYPGTNDFDDLKIPFRAVATDLVTAKTLSLKSGSLSTAIRASSTVPLRFTPVKLNDKVLIDGGLLANVPVEAASEFSPDVIIIINTSSALLKREQLNKPWNLADQVVSIMMNYFSRNAGSKADVEIVPDLGDHNNLDFTNIDSLILLGKNAVRSNLDQIKKIIDSKQDSIIQNSYVSRILKLQGIKEIQAIAMSGFSSGDSASISAAVAGIPQNDFASLVKLIIKQPNSANYSGYKFAVAETAGRKFLVISAMEFPRFKRLKITGSDAVFIPAIEHDINEHFANSILSQDMLKDICEKIIRSYRRNQYSVAHVYDIGYSKSDSTLLIDMDDSKILKIRVNCTSGNDYLIKKEITFAENEPLNVDDLLTFWENVVNKDVFEDVEINVDHPEDKKGVDVEINSKVLGTQTVRIGARADDERHTQLGVDFIQENLFNFDTRLTLRGITGIRNNSISLNLETPRFMRSNVTFDLKGFYSNRNVNRYMAVSGLPSYRFQNKLFNEYNEERFGLLGSLGMMIEKSGTISVQFRSERQRYFDTDSSKKVKFYGINTVKFESLFDSENKAEFATKGRLIDISLETTLLQSPDAVGFSKAVFLIRDNYSFSRYTLRPSAFFGFADDGLPLPECFSLGGQSIFFGMREDESRGRQIALMNAEFRALMPFSIIFPTYMSLRYDLGSIWEHTSDIKYSKLSHGIGATIGLDTPLGPASFSLGRCFKLFNANSTIMMGPVMAYFSIGLKL